MSPHQDDGFDKVCLCLPSYPCCPSAFGTHPVLATFLGVLIHHVLRSRRVQPGQDMSDEASHTASWMASACVFLLAVRGPQALARGSGEAGLGALGLVAGLAGLLPRMASVWLDASRMAMAVRWYAAIRFRSQAWSSHVWPLAVQSGQGR